MAVSKEDTNKVNVLNNLSWRLKSLGHFDTAMAYARKALILANTLPVGNNKGWTKGVATAYNNIGLLYMYLGQYPEALKTFFDALKMREEMGDKKGIAYTYNNIGNVYYHQGLYPEALKQHFAALKIREETGDKQGVASSYGNIGLVYDKQHNYADALKNYSACLKIMEELGDKQGIANSYNNIGMTYFSLHEYPEALRSHFEAIKRYEENGDKNGLSNSYNNLGIIYYELHNYTEALKNQFASIKLSEESGNKDMVAMTYGNIGNTYKDLKNYKEAEAYSLKALAMGKEIGDEENIMFAHQHLSEIYKATGRHQQALESYKEYIVARDSLNNLENTKKTVQQQLSYEFDKKEAAEKLEDEKKEAVTAAESRKQQEVILAVSIGLGVVLILAVIILRSLRSNQRKNKIITEQKKLVEMQKHIVEEKHREITDSINYAERIQRSFLATRQLLDENLGDYFVFFQSKDVVSGDFYWAGKLKNNQFALVTADSTGHGVPGSIMSILNISCLENAIKEGLDGPAEILNHTRTNIIDRLKKDGSAEGGKDGMDCSLISFDFSRNKFTYAAANNPVWVVREKQVLEYSPDKMPVGKHDRDSVSFTEHTIDLQKGDVIYALTDGMPDQFGGPKGKKFMYKQLKELLISVSHLPMEEQKTTIANSFNGWKGSLEQVDDVTLIGVRL